MMAAKLISSDEKKRLIQLYRKHLNDGGSQIDFCVQHGINTRSLCGWVESTNKKYNLFSLGGRPSLIDENQL